MNTCYNQVYYEPMYNGSYGSSQGCSCFSFSTLIILILIVLQFSNRNNSKNYNEDDDDYDDKHGKDNKGGYQSSNIIDNSILFIIAFFFLVCGCGCVKNNYRY